MVSYGDQEGGRVEAPRGLGDPMTVGREKRPTTDSLARWVKDLAGRPDAVALCQRILASLADEDLATWGYERGRIEAELASVPAAGGAERRRPLSRYTLERKALVLLRRNIHQNAFGRLVRRVRFVCDVLLR
jgi:hypothetical protein